MTAFELTDEQRDQVRTALLSPDLTICKGEGTATVPGAGQACTIAEINLTLTGELHDGPHPCISDVIRAWVIRVQDAMPDKIRNSRAWREAACGIAGSAAMPEIEQQRTELLLKWMWEALADEAFLAAVPDSVRAAWDHMLQERTATAADAARDATAAAADAAAYAAAAYAAYAAYAAAGRDTGAYWERRDVPGMLARLIECGR